MILGFKQRFADGHPTFFKERIMVSVGILPNGWIIPPKIHTIRSGNRWKVGMTIQMGYGVRTKAYSQFNKGIDGLQICKSVQDIYMTYDGLIRIIIDNKPMDKEIIKKLIVNDGLNKHRFREWFFPKGENTFTGQIIHWTDFKY